MKIYARTNIVHGSLVQSVRDDIAKVKASPFIRREFADRSFGYAYDLGTGRLRPVKS